MISIFYRYKSGLFPPDEIKFEDLSRMDPETLNTKCNTIIGKGTYNPKNWKKRPFLSSVFGVVGKTVCI